MSQHQICDVSDCDKPAKWLVNGPPPSYFTQLCDEHATPKESHR